MQTSNQLLQRLKAAQKKIEQAGNSAYVELEPTEFAAITEHDRPDGKAPEPDYQPPGFYPTQQDEPAPKPAQTTEYTPPPPDPDAPLTENERKYAHSQSLTAIYSEDPGELPKRVMERTERLLELREEMNRPYPWSWMT
jgi:hypothetical protein